MSGTEFAGRVGSGFIGLGLFEALTVALKLEITVFSGVFMAIVGLLIVLVALVVGKDDS